MGKKKMLFVVILGILTFALVACSEDTQGDGGFISIGTGSTGGVYFSLGTGMAKIISDNLDGVNATASSTGGSVDNVNLLSSGEETFVIADMSVSLEAYEGDVPDLRGIYMGYANVFHLITKDESIQTFDDLIGKVVAVGPRGSGTANMSEKVFKDLGIWDDINVEYLTHEQESQDLGDGRIDAAAYSIALPGTSVESFFTANDGHFIEFTDEQIQEFLDENPDHVHITIESGTYPGQDTDIETVGVKAALLTMEDTDEDLVYEVTKTLLDNEEGLIDYHPAGAEFNFENALEGMEIPLHEGAKRYFEEEGHPDIEQSES